MAGAGRRARLSRGKSALIATDMLPVVGLFWPRVCALVGPVCRCTTPRATRNSVLKIAFNGHDSSTITIEQTLAIGHDRV